MSRPLSPTPIGPDRDLLLEAVEVVVDRRHASAPYLQRRIRVGFAKAGRLMQLMEERGIVGRTSDGVSTFEVLVPREDKWLAMDAIRGETP
jgi:S-DNA-T family DNA segregation ATPase FtsK/SpoIIIE